MPGAEPTDEDLRHDAELTRQELAETVVALGHKADVKGRIQDAAHKRGDELMGKLPDPVATKVRPVVDTATRKPMIPIASLLALLIVLKVWLSRRKR
jgi:hypothetical protein